MRVKLQYYSSGRYKTTIEGKIDSWGNGAIHFYDTKKMYHTIKEEKLISIKPAKPLKPVCEIIRDPEQMTIDDLDEG